MAEDDQPNPVKPADVKPDVYLAACPSREVLSRIGDKWTSLVLGLLSGGPVRFGGLQRRVQGISRKMLTQTLRNCQRDGLISRHMTGEKMPVKVEYQLTDLGKTLIPIISQAKAWAESNLKTIEATRAEFDRRNNVRIPIDPIR